MTVRLERVLQMPPREIVGRGRQEASKWLDRLAAPHRRHKAIGLPRDAGRNLRARFFAGAAYADAAAQRLGRMPEISERIISNADAVCRGRFDLLGYRDLDFGDPVDWHLDPVSGRRAPFVHFSHLDPLDPAVVGDSKVVWELNRHQWFLQLGEAYRLTGDERYAEAFAGYVQAWMRANPPGMGINWASSLEVAFRLIAWCWSLVLFHDSPALDEGLRAEMAAGIASHARHVERYLSSYFSPNTHLTGEALGLFYAGVLVPELRRAARWRALGMAILVAECERQIWPDGVYFEQSTSYQRYTAEIYLHFVILAARNGIGVPDGVAGRLQRLLDFLVAIRRPDGSMPLIGDADGGRLLPLTSRAADDVRDVMAVAAAFFARSDYAWAAGGAAPEILWMLGEPGLRTFASLTPAPPRTPPSRLFSTGGYAILRAGWEPDAHQLVFDGGPFGNSGHAHADLLSLQCAVFGEPFLVDAGSDGYTAHPEWRNFFRGAAAHSTVRVDNQPHAAPAGPFKWASRPRVLLRRWVSTETLDLADAEHDAYHCLADPVSHRRRVAFVKPRYWVVVDDLTGTGMHQLELQFQFAPLPVTVDPTLWARVLGRRRGGLLIRPFASVRLRAEVYQGETAPPRGWVSPDYGLRRPAPVLMYAAEAQLPLRVVTLLLPVDDPALPPPRVSLQAAGAALMTLVFADTGETLHVDDDDVRSVGR